MKNKKSNEIPAAQTQDHLWSSVQHHTPHRHRSSCGPMSSVTLLIDTGASGIQCATHQAEESSVLNMAGKAKLRRVEMQKLSLLFHSQGKEKSQEPARIQLSKFHPNILERFSPFVFIAKYLEVMKYANCLHFSHHFILHFFCNLVSVLILLK